MRDLDDDSKRTNCYCLLITIGLLAGGVGLGAETDWSGWLIIAIVLVIVIGIWKKKKYPGNYIDNGYYPNDDPGLTKHAIIFWSVMIGSGIGAVIGALVMYNDTFVWICLIIFFLNLFVYKPLVAKMYPAY